MLIDAQTALKNTSDLDQKIDAQELIASAEDLLEITDWEAAQFGRPKKPLPDLPANSALTFFQSELNGEDIVIAVAERPHTLSLYVPWLGTHDQAEEDFYPAT